MTEQHENPTKGQKKHCVYLGCRETYPDHYWGSVKAHGEGWYQQKNGLVWCPRHRPSWAPELKAAALDAFVEVEAVGTVTKALVVELGEGKRLYSPEVEITPIVGGEPGQFSLHPVQPFRYV